VDTHTSAPPLNGPSLTDRVLKATSFIAVAHVIAKLLGIVQARVIGHYYGFSIENDAFVLAYEGILWTLFLIGEESLGPAFLPVFMTARNSDSEEAAWTFTSTLLNLQLLLLMVSVVLLMLFPDAAVRLLSQFSDHGRKADNARAELAVRFVGYMAPSLLGLSIGSLTYVILNGYKRFFWPAFADAVLKAGLAVGIAVGWKLGLSHDAMIVGVLAAGLGKISVHLWALRDKLKHYRPVIRLKDPHFRKFMLLVAPLLIGILFAKTRDFYNYYYILSTLEEGMLSVNSYGRKLYNAVSWLVPYPLAIALFPFFCELVARDDQKALGNFLTRATRMLLLIFLPMTAVILVLSTPLAQALFQTGKVTAADAALAGRVNAYYSAVIPFFALEFIFMQAYFSSHRNVAVTVIGILFSAMSMLISYVGVVTYELRGPDALAVVALGYTFSRALKAITLAGVLKYSGVPLLPFGSTMRFLARCLLLTVACGGAAFGGLKIVERVQGKSAETSTELRPDPKERAEKDADAKKSDGKEAPEKKAPSGSGMKALLRAAPQLVFPGLLTLIVFIAGCKLLRLDELDEMIGYAREKIRRRGKGSAMPTDAGAA